jgi:F0F1-type ATP synthase assembly protein I
MVITLVWLVGTVLFWVLADRCAGNRDGAGAEDAVAKWINFLGADENGPPPPGAPADWNDLYARADPVPLGSMNLNDPYTSTEVRNRDSIPSDHTYYWRNTDQFVGPVAARIMEDAGWPLGGNPRIQTVDRSDRPHRANQLDGAFLLNVATCIVALIAVVVGGFAREISAPIGRLATFLADQLTIPFEGILRANIAGEDVARTVTSAIVIIAVAMIWYTIAVLPSWERWNATQTDRFFRDERPDTDRGGEYFRWVRWSVPIVVALSLWAISRIG